MTAVGSPEAAPRCDHRDNRVEKASCLVDDVSQAFMMGVGEVALEGSGLDGIDRQNREQHLMSAERFLVNSHHVAASFFNHVSGLSRGSFRSLQPGFPRSQTFCAGLGFARTPSRRCTLNHRNDSTVARASFYLCFS